MGAEFDSIIERLDPVSAIDFGKGDKDLIENHSKANARLRNLSILNLALDFGIALGIALVVTWLLPNI